MTFQREMFPVRTERMFQANDMKLPNIFVWRSLLCRDTGIWFLYVDVGILPQLGHGRFLSNPFQFIGLPANYTKLIAAFMGWTFRITGPFRNVQHCAVQKYFYFSSLVIAFVVVVVVVVKRGWRTKFGYGKREILPPVEESYVS
jgi:hypothetical protein